MKIITILIMMGTALALDEVTVLDGVIKVPPGYICDINVNGIDMIKNGTNTIVGLFFGLIRYDCKNITGILISKLECKMCGLFCNYNQLIVGCEQYWGPFLVGLLIGLLPIVIIALLFRRIINGLMTKLCEIILYKYNKYRDNKEQKKTKSIELRTRIKATPIFKQPLNTKEKYISKTLARRDALSSEYVELNKVTSERNMDSDQGTAPEYSKQGPPVPPRPDNIYNKSSAKSTNYKKYPSLTNLAVGALLVTSSLQPGECCSNTLFIHSNGKICDSNKCVDSGMYDMPLMTGSVVCFKDYDGETMKIKVDEAYFRSRYYLQYYTSDFEIDTKSVSRCKGAGNCWNGGCLSNSVHRDLLHDNNGTVNGYGCDSDTVGCDDYCYHQTSCTWYKWSIKSVGPLYPVYSKVSKIWEVIVSVNYKGIIAKHRVNVNNPRLNLDGLFTTMPLYITGFESEDTAVKNGLIIKDGHGYQATISDSNMPQSDIIGDYQISLDQKTHTFNEHDVRCQVNSCHTVCQAKNSKVRRFTKNINRHEALDVVSIGNKYIIETKRNVKAVIKALIGNVSFNNLQIEQAQCGIDVVTTYSCTGCTTKPFAVLQPYSIKHEGILPITSNCSFDQNFISCNADPYELTLSDYQKVCHINIPTINQSLIINFEFSFIGQLDPSKPIYAVETQMEVVTGIVKSEGFINGLIGVFSTVSIIGIGSNLILRIFKVWQYSSLAKQQINTHA